MEAAVSIHRALLQSIRDIEPDSPAAYLFATALVAIAALFRFTIVPFGSDISPFVTFFPATLFAAFVGGWRAGLFAALLGGGISWWGFISPIYGFFPLTPGAVAGLIAYTVTSLIIIVGADHHRSLIEKLKAEERYRQMVVDELAHRLKNKVATIQSIVGYQLRDNPQLRDSISGRLGALSGTDDLIMATQGRGAPLHEIVSTETGPYDAARAQIDGPTIMLAPKLALSMALIVHELATNAAKHGALSSPSGRVSIRWQLSSVAPDKPPATTLRMEWQESGGPPVSLPAVRGFGLRLLAIALDQFNGTVHPIFEPEGFICRIALPLPATANPSGYEQSEALRRNEPSGSSPGHPIHIAPTFE